MANPYYEPLLKLIERKGARQQIFTFAELREDLGIDASERSKSQKIWNAWNQAKKRRIIKYSDPYEKRSRNRRYAMGDIGALSRELAKVAKPSGNGKSPTTTARDSEPSVGQGMMDRLSRIEERLNLLVSAAEDKTDDGGSEEVKAVLTKLDVLDAKVNKLMSIWS